MIPLQIYTALKLMLVVLIPSLAGCDIFLRDIRIIFGISTHTSLAGWDPKSVVVLANEVISTHTSLARCDMSVYEFLGLATDFNSHIPRGM